MRRMLRCIRAVGNRPPFSWVGWFLSTCPGIRRIWARRLGRLVIVGGLGFAVFNAVAMVATSQNWFCNSCHIMNTYHASWQVSAHKDVNCTDCHIKPGFDNFITAKMNGMGQLVDDILGRTSSKASASVSDKACTRSGCHDPAEVRATVKKEGKYLFDHGKHMDLDYEGIGSRCTLCHSHVKGDEHFEVNTNVCVTCHLLRRPAETETIRVAKALVSPAVLTSTPPGPLPATMAISTRPTTGPAGPAEKVPTQECRKCHEPPADTVEYRGLKVVHSKYLAYGAACEACHHQVTQRPRPIEDAQCYACHDYGKERVTTVEDLHHEHATAKHKVECFSCHGVIAHGPKAESMRMDRFDCRSCHENHHVIQQNTYMIAGMPLPLRALPQPAASRPVASMPATSQPATSQPAKDFIVTPMFLAHVDCTGCHVKQTEYKTKPGTGMKVTVATPESCDRCHEPGLGKQMVPMWQRDTRQLYDELAKMLASTKPAKDAESRQALAEARDLLNVIRLDGSWGVHNPRYTQELLKQAQAKLVELHAMSVMNTEKPK